MALNESLSTLWASPELCPKLFLILPAPAPLCPPSPALPVKASDSLHSIGSPYAERSAANGTGAVLRPVGRFPLALLFALPFFANTLLLGGTLLFLGFLLFCRAPLSLVLHPPLASFCQGRLQ